MNLIDLPTEILEHILSYNMIPYTSRVCKELNEIEESLFDCRCNRVRHSPLLYYIGIDDRDSLLFCFFHIYDMESTDMDILTLTNYFYKKYPSFIYRIYDHIDIGQYLEPLCQTLVSVDTCIRSDLIHLMCKKISSYDVMFEILYLGYHELASDIFYNHKLELKDIMEAIATRLEYIYTLETGKISRI